MINYINITEDIKFYFVNMELLILQYKGKQIGYIKIEDLILNDNIDYLKNEKGKDFIIKLVMKDDLKKVIEYDL